MSTRMPTGPDWERIEADYRAGVLSLREIAAKNAITEGAIRKRAKKLSWSRNLTALIRAKADELVRSDAVRSDGTQPRTTAFDSNCVIPNADELAPGGAVRIDAAHGTQQDTAAAPTDQAVVEANAHAIAAVRLAHRTDIARARRLCLTLTDELELLTGRREELRDLIDAIDEEALDTKGIERLRAALEKAIALPVRAGTLKSLTDSLKALVTLEREAWQIDKVSTDATYDDFLAEIHGEDNSPASTK